MFLCAEEDFLAVHVEEDEEEDGGVGEVYEDGIVVADVLLEAMEEGAADAREADDVRHGVGGNAVHAIDLQQGEVAMMLERSGLQCRRMDSVDCVEIHSV